MTILDFNYSQYIKPIKKKQLNHQIMQSKQMQEPGFTIFDYFSGAN